MTILMIFLATATLLLPLIAVAGPYCAQNTTFSETGFCFEYQRSLSCSGVLLGKTVYLPFFENYTVEQTIARQEAFTVTIMATLIANQGLISEECLTVGDAWACNAVYPPCTKASATEGIPQLPCESFCQDLWSACSVAFNQFNIGTILGTKTFDVDEFAFPSCPGGPGNGTFQVDPQPTDVFGERDIRALGAFPRGYLGQPRNPANSANFKLLNGTSVNVPCFTPPVPAEPLNISSFLPAPSCPFPLELDATGTCVIPCPFPVIAVDKQAQIENAFVVPGLISLFFCVFVLLDSLFVIAESQGFAKLLNLRKKFLNANHSKTEENTTSGTGVNTTSKSGSKRRRNALRAATVYSLMGALLGIIYFFVGPMVTLIRKQFVSCGIAPVTINLGNVALGTADLTDSFCEAQRVAPFLLQMIFNLILYAIVQVFVVVTEKSRRWNDRQKLAFEVSLISYCAGIPVLFLIIALKEDHLSTDVVDFITQFSRNSAVCVPRLTVGQEVTLIWMPFTITGILITWLSLFIYSHLSLISNGVNEFNAPGNQKNSSAVALRLLMTRLSGLGIATFCVTLMFIAASASLIRSVSNFAPKFNTFFGCQAATKLTCQNCTDLSNEMLASIPSAVSFAAQIFAMSSISLLFGGFFAAQSFARLYKEYQDGTLKLKLTYMWQGKALAMAKANMLESSIHSFTPLHEAGKSFTNMSEKLNETKDAVRESCLSIMYGRYKNWRHSHLGRGRGEVFRWQKRRTMKKKKFDFVPSAWNSRAENVSKVQRPGMMQSLSTDSSNKTKTSGWRTSFTTPRKESSVPEGSIAWNKNFLYDSSDSAAPNRQKASSPVQSIEDDDDFDATMRRPPSRCPSI